MSTDKEKLDVLARKAKWSEDDEEYVLALAYSALSKAPGPTALVHRDMHEALVERARMQGALAELEAFSGFLDECDDGEDCIEYLRDMVRRRNAQAERRRREVGHGQG